MSSAGWLGDFIQQHGFGVGLLAVFFGGLALNLTPCVYPMIPVTLAFFSSQSSGSYWKTGRLAIVYVLGISLSYAVLGVLAANTGALLGSWLQNPWVLLGIAAVIVSLAMSLFGFYTLQPPRFITERLGQASSGLWGAFVMGLVIGVVAAPCIGPFVLGLMLVVSQLANPWKGFFLFFALGVGMGLPYIVLAMLANKIGRLPRAGGWLVWSKHLLGFTLLGLALFVTRSLFPAIAVQWAAGLILAGAGIFLGWIERSTVKGRLFLWTRFFTGTALLAVSLFVVWPRQAPKHVALWTAYSRPAFEQAVMAGKPAIIDIYADWCLPCVELDHVTFRNPDVVAALSGVQTLRIDATREVSQDVGKLFDAYDVFGVPTVLFFDALGKERADLRMIGFETPAEFLKKLKALSAKTP